MLIFHKTEDLKKQLLRERQTGKKLGFVPTMGALHDGHMELIKASRKEHDKTICSIFVNPTQFNDPTDFEKYPQTLQQDIKKLETMQCSILFLPSVEEMYPSGTALLEQFPIGSLETILEGKYRPGHFQGVCQIVDHLLTIVEPDTLYLGQKDYQQCMVLHRLLELRTYKQNTKIKIVPTLREQDGLAMSSRNIRLDTESRKTASQIYQCLLNMKSWYGKLELEEIKIKVQEDLTHHGFRVDYAEIADALTLEPIRKYDPEQHAVALIAAFINDVRLIDNLVLTDTTTDSKVSN